MFNTDFVTVQHLHQTRLRDERRSERDVILAAREQTPPETQADFLREIRQRIQTYTQQQEVSETRRAHAV